MYTFKDKRLGKEVVLGSYISPSEYVVGRTRDQGRRGDDGTLDSCN